MVDTFAGGKIRTGVPAQDVFLSQFGGIAFDPAGNLVLCDQTSNVIRRIRTDGTIETIVGNGTTGFSGDGGPALSAALNQPALPRYDAQGNLYFSDSSNFRIRRVDSKGVITSIAGSGVPFQTGMDLEGPALSRSLNTLGDLAVDPAGNVYFTLSNNSNVIRRVTTAGRLEIFAGIPHPDCPNCTTGDNGPAKSAQIAPALLAADGKGNLYFSEYVFASELGFATHIRRIAPDGALTPFAGYGPIPVTGGTVDDEGKPALGISIYQIGAMTADAAGNLYFVQAGRPVRSSVGARIRRIDTSGIVNTIAGGPVSSPSPDGPPLQTAISPTSLAVDTHGNVAFTDTLKSTIATYVGVVREVTAQAILINLAGAAPKPAPDGTPARDAWLLNPTSITFNRAGDLFIAEFGSCLIRKIGSNGLLATAAGTGKCGASLPATPNTTQDLTPPAAIVADPQGGFYVLDTFGNSYRIGADGKLAPAGFPPTLGSGKLAIDAKGRVLLMSMFNLVRISSDGKQETIVAMPSQPGVPPQGFGPTSLGGIGTDPVGNVYFTGTYLGAPTDYVFRVNDDGTFTQVYGSATNQLHLSTFIPSLAVDSNTNVWLGNTFVNATGSYSLGSSYAGYSGDGGFAQSASFNATQSAFSPATGDHYLLDSGRIRKISGASPARPANITAGGIVNAVSYTGGGIAPGELIAIFGFFASGFPSADLQINAPENNRIPWVLGRTKVLFDGYPGAITAWSPTQINVFVPYWLTPGKSSGETRASQHRTPRPSHPSPRPSAVSLPKSPTLEPLRSHRSVSSRSTSGFPPPSRREPRRSPYPSAAFRPRNPSPSLYASRPQAPTASLHPGAVPIPVQPELPLPQTAALPHPPVPTWRRPSPHRRTSASPTYCARPVAPAAPT
jgi:sugar lactone lactonase YvrE